MKIEQNTLFLKTSNHFFGMEKEGQKPYTIRLLNHEEFLELGDVEIDKIHIQNADISSQSFEREVLSIVDLGELLGKHLTGIAWKAVENGNG